MLLRGFIKDVCDTANAKFEKWLSEQPNVFLKYENGEFVDFARKINQSTHIGRLIDVREIVE